MFTVHLFLRTQTEGRMDGRTGSSTHSHCPTCNYSARREVKYNLWPDNVCYHTKFSRPVADIIQRYNAHDHIKHAHL